MKPDVLATAPLPSWGMDPLNAEFTVHRLWEAEDQKAFLAERGERIRGMTTPGGKGADAALMDALPRLEIISCFGVGVDGIDLAAAKARGIIVTNTPDVLTDCVADLAMALTLAVARRVVEGDRFVRAGRWRQGPLPLGTKLGGRRMGIVGLGRIGKAIARRAEVFGMTILYHGRRPQPGVPYAYYADLEEMARDSDVLMVACPGGQETFRIVDKKILQAVGRDGILINIARGTVVDEQALVEALQSGALGAAGLDVFENEPHVPEALLSMENVVLQPHQASATNDTRRAMAELTVENLRAHFAGRPVLTRVV